MPRVSVVIPAFNAASYLSKAILSVVGQTERDWELIIVDDGSTDQTVAIAQEHSTADDRIKLLRLGKSEGPGHARNCGIAAASGTWVTFLDADDWYHPQRLETLLDTAERNQASVIVDNQFFVLEGQTHPWRALLPYNQHALTWLTVRDVLRESRFGRMFNIGLLKPMIRASVIQAHFMSYKEELRIGEDYLVLLMACVRAGKVFFVSAPHYYYNVRKDSLSRAATLQDLRTFRAALEPMLIEMSYTQIATSRELDDLRSDLYEYIQCHVIEEHLRRGRLFDALSALLFERLLIGRLLHFFSLWISRKVARLWRQNPPQLITRLHEMHLSSDLPRFSARFQLRRSSE